jgi:putative Holliday junction resolvase
LWDERLSTVAAHGSLREQGVAGRAQRKIVDQVAATLLLQSFLEHVGRGRMPDPSEELEEPSGST